MQSKTDQIRDLMQKGDHRRALAIAARFPNHKPDFIAMKRAHAAFQQPDFYRQIGKDPVVLIADGIEALLKIYGGPQC